MRASPCQRLNSAKLQGSPSALVTSGVNGILKRKVVSPQWDSRARPAKRQHRRCIGCEKNLAFPPLGCWLAFAGNSILCHGIFSNLSNHKLLQFDLRTNTDRHAKVSRPACATYARRKQTNC